MDNAFALYFSTPASRWRALTTRDVRADRAFVYCVKTTGIFCRPTCKARLARQSNVEFHDTADAARSSGYRPCKRCRPDLTNYAPDADKINRARRTLENLSVYAQFPKLEDLAGEVGLSKYHFHRAFKKATGLTPKGYWRQNGLDVDLYKANIPYQPVRALGPVTPTDLIYVPLHDPVELEAMLNLYGYDMDFNEINLVDAVPKEQIVYDTMHTPQGVTIVAYRDDQICFTETASTEVEAMAEFDKAFPASTYRRDRYDSIFAAN